MKAADLDMVRMNVIYLTATCIQSNINFLNNLFNFQNETNSNVRYFVPESDGKFDVNPTTGELFVNASLDFETNSTYTFMVCVF